MFPPLSVPILTFPSHPPNLVTEDEYVTQKENPPPSPSPPSPSQPLRSPPPPPPPHPLLPGEMSISPFSPGHTKRTPVEEDIQPALLPRLIMHNGYAWKGAIHAHACVGELACQNQNHTFAMTTCAMREFGNEKAEVMQPPIDMRGGGGRLG